MKNIFFALCVLSITCCGVRDELSEAELQLSNQEYAIPLINSSLSINGLADIESKGSASIIVDEEGRATAIYEGRLVRNEAEFLFPPIPGVGDNVLPEPNSSIRLPFNPEYQIREATFKNTNMFFYFEHSHTEASTVKVTVPDLKKDGEVWSMTYDISSNAETLQIETSRTSLQGWQVFPNDNFINFIYEAFDAEGNAIKFDYAAMRIDVLAFSSVIGYFGNRVFDISGDNININIFDSWISGGLDFSDPKLTIEVENSFGFPVRSRVNQMQIFTKDNNSFVVESELINQGIDFGYPTLEEGTVVKETEFFFDKNNSNLRQLFNDKITSISYDIDAIANPDGDESITNFINLGSYFQVNAFVEVPMLGQAFEFTIADTTNLELEQLADAEEAEFKVLSKNGFPAEMAIQVYFLDENDATLDSLFSEGRKVFEAAEIRNGEKADVPSDFVERFERFDNERIENIARTKRIYVVGTLDTSKKFGEALWIFDDYVFDLKVGAKVKLKDN